MRLELPATVVAGRLRAGSSWLTRHAAACDEDELRVRLGPGRPGWLGTTVAVHLGEPADVGAGVMVPFVWEATGPLGLFPRFEGKLQLAGLDPERCELSLSGHYRPPLGKWATSWMTRCSPAPPGPCCVPSSAVSRAGWRISQAALLPPHGRDAPAGRRAPGLTRDLPDKSRA